MNLLSDRIAVDAAIFGRACRGEHYSGDLALIRDTAQSTFLAVVDVAGHGRSAHSVATKIESFLAKADTADLSTLVKDMHQDLVGGLGAVIFAGTLNPKNDEFTYVHIGDTHGKVFGPHRRTLVGQPGMLGESIRTPTIGRVTLGAGDLLVLCTDGIHEHYDLSEIQGYRTVATANLAHQVVDRFGKNHDDATCLVLRYG